MRQQGRLDIDCAFATERGPRVVNADFGGVYLGSATERALSGIVAAVADGVGDALPARHAAELAVRELIDAYYCQPETIGVVSAGSRALEGINRWLHAAMLHHAAFPQSSAAGLTTLTCCILRGRYAHILHVGDSRAWHWRDGVLTRLTQDHCHPQREYSHVLQRALGMEPTLRLDQHRVGLALGDRIVLATDGIHGWLDDRRMAKLVGTGSVHADVSGIIDAARTAGGSDNATAIVIEITELPAQDADTVNIAAADLPPLTDIQTGMQIDGFRLDQLVSEGRSSSVFRAHDLSDGATVAIKVPKPSLIERPGGKAALIREMLVGLRARNPHVGRCLPIDPQRQSAFYIVMPFYEGQTLTNLVEQSPLPLDRAIAIARAIAEGLASLHRLGIVHRDVKPDNVIVGRELDAAVLIDAGSARIERLQDDEPYEIPGTPPFLAPEMFDGALGDEATDQYAFGMTLYYLLTGRLALQSDRSRKTLLKLQPPSAFRKDIPDGIDRAVLRMLSPKARDRFGDMIEARFALQLPLNDPPPVQRPSRKRWFFAAAAAVWLIPFVGQFVPTA